jgi:hypothetical protein
MTASVRAANLFLLLDIVLVETAESLQVSTFNSFAARRILERRQSSGRSKGAPLLSKRPKTIDVDDTVDPEWLNDGTLDENYDA